MLYLAVSPIRTWWCTGHKYLVIEMVLRPDFNLSRFVTSCGLFGNELHIVSANTLKDLAAYVLCFVLGITSKPMSLDNLSCLCGAL